MYGECKQSFVRIQDFLLLTELQEGMKGSFKQNKDHLSLKVKGNFTWGLTRTAKKTTDDDEEVKPEDKPKVEPKDEPKI